MPEITQYSLCTINPPWECPKDNHYRNITSKYSYQFFIFNCQLSRWGHQNSSYLKASFSAFLGVHHYFLSQRYVIIPFPHRIQYSYTTSSCFLWTQILNIYVTIHVSDVKNKKALVENCILYKPLQLLDGSEGFNFQEHDGFLRKRNFLDSVKQYRHPIFPFLLPSISWQDDSPLFESLQGWFQESVYFPWNSPKELYVVYTIWIYEYKNISKIFEHQRLKTFCQFEIFLYKF